MRRLVLQSLLTASALLWPVGAFALPGNISDLEAEYNNGQIYVHWTPPTSGDAISYYRVYISHRSILDNNGTYDDYERTNGARAEHIIVDVPPTPQVFVAVLAVNAKGEEGGYFTEEIGLTIPQGQTSSKPVQTAPVVQAQATSSAQTSAPGITWSSSSSSSSAQAAVKDEESSLQELLMAEAVSATGVLLTFSQPVLLSQTDAGSAFTIKDGSGQLLPVTRLMIQGNTILLHTVKQEKMTVYQIRVSSAVQGKNVATGAVLPFNVAKSLMLFTGHPTGMDPEVPVVTNQPPTDVTDLKITYVVNATGKYTVTAQWKPSSAKNVKNYIVRQSRDSGKTFGDPQLVAGSVTSVIFRNVPAGDFGVGVQAAASQTLVSRGVATSVMLPVTNRGDDLSNSGAGLLITFGLSGGFVGWKRMRRRAN